MALPTPRTGVVRIWDEQNFWNGRAKLQWTLRERWEKTCFNDWSCFVVDVAKTTKHYWCCNAKKNLCFPCWARLQAAIHSAGYGGVSETRPNLRRSFARKSGKRLWVTIHGSCSPLG